MHAHDDQTLDSRTPSTAAPPRRSLARSARPLLAGAALALAGCALGPVRQARVDALGPWKDVTGLTVTVAPGAPPGVAPALESAARTTLATHAHLVPAAEGDGSGFRLQLTAAERRLTDAELGVGDAFAFASGAKAPTSALAVEGLLFAPGETEPKGLVRWDKSGDLATLASAAGSAIGSTFAEKLNVRREQFFDRRAADERLFLTPTPSLLEPGNFAISNDEVLLFRLAWGLGRRVQFDLWVGGFPIPFAAGGFLPPVHAVAGAGVAGVGLLGVVDLGLKFKLVEEDASLPGVALSYDLLDAFGALIGAGGGIVIGNGLLIAGAPGIAGVNVQLNVFTLSVGKHFGKTQVTGGLWVVDNHNFLPQSAGFAVGVFASNGESATSSGSTPIPNIPTTVQPFFGVERVLGPHSALAAELMPRWPVRDTVFTTGARWLLGFDEPKGPIAFDRIRVRLDAALVWVILPDSPSALGGRPFPLPWLGLGIYAL